MSREIIVKEWHDDKGLIHRREIGQELVRCKECKHSEESLVSGSVYYNEMDRAISENGFCHKGEHKESDR